MEELKDLYYTISEIIRDRQQFKETGLTLEITDGLIEIRNIIAEQIEAES